MHSADCFDPQRQKHCPVLQQPVALLTVAQQIPCPTARCLSPLEMHRMPPQEHESEDRCGLNQRQTYCVSDGIPGPYCFYPLLQSESLQVHRPVPVSYTHLTLPTN